ncbi:hypothetical protein V5K30_RS22405 [Enterobacter hormaechei]|uniref:hypothetical protein n=1 Tax=Klebsiella/Raoultella group TaxID=2890311 RepID=UPI000BA8592D|nr:MULTISPECIES: hypothetical protein [Klebsiella/Raoultella group]EHN8738110.1 hypothetical protein [Enterobacter hormaechei]PAO03803.1 hypothetical protein CIW61_10000 [Enterobacter cloacae]HEB4094241.1 hypothetical protein [Enterobacter cloacae]
MTQQELQVLLNVYNERLFRADNYIFEFAEISNDLERRVRDGRLTKAQADFIIEQLLKSQVGLENWGPLQESIEKRGYEVSFDGADKLASLVAAMRRGKQ